MVFNTGAGHDEAAKAYQDNLAIQREINNPHGQASCFHGLGNIYSDRGLYSEAIQFYTAALETYQRIMFWQEDADIRIDVAVTRTGLANVLVLQGRFTEAASHCRDSANILINLGNFASAGNSLCSLALCHFLNRRNEEAIATAREAVAVYAQTEDEKGKQGAARLLEDLHVGRLRSRTEEVN